MNTMAKMSRSNCKARAWLNEHGYQEVHFFPHTRFSKDLNFRGLKFDGIALSETKLCLFQVKSNCKPSNVYQKLMQDFSSLYGVDCLWFDAIDYVGLKVYGNEPYQLISKPEEANLGGDESFWDKW